MLTLLTYLANNMIQHTSENKVKICQEFPLSSSQCSFIGRWGLLGEGSVVATVVVAGVLSAVASAAQHYRLCWPGLQCETDHMLPDLIILNQGRRHGVDWGGHVHPIFPRSVFVSKQKRYEKH